MNENGGGRVIVACLVLSLLASHHLCSATVSDETNAAVYYSKAFELLQYPDSKEIQNQLQQTIKNGWRDENKHLEEILLQNGKVFDEFRKGVSLHQCDFDFGKESKWLVPEPLQVRNLSSLVLLKARFNERQGNVHEAVTLYLSLFTFSQHLAQHDSLPSKLYAITIQRMASSPLKERLTAKDASVEERLRISAFLEDYERELFPVAQLLQPEKAAFISKLESTLTKYLKANKAAGENGQKRVALFKEEALRQGRQLGDWYYGLLVKAAQINAEGDWKAAEKGIRNLKQETERTEINWGEFRESVSTMFGRSVIRESVGSQRSAAAVSLSPPELEKAASQFAKLLLILFVSPSYRGGVDGYYLAVKELRELRSLAKGQEATVEPSAKGVRENSSNSQSK